MEELAAAIISSVGSLGAAYLAFTQVKFSNASQAAGETARRFRPPLVPAIALIAVLSGGAVFGIASSLDNDEAVNPASVPGGFTALSWREGQVGIAIPSNWQREEVPLQMQLIDPQSGDQLVLVIGNSSDRELALIENDVDAAVEDLALFYQQLIPALQIVGAPVSQPHQGQTGFRVPIRFQFVGAPVSPGFIYVILDYDHDRILFLIYDSGDVAERMVTTLNLG